jgi:hypothetical protein
MSGKEFSFLTNRLKALETHCAEIGFEDGKSMPTFGVSRAQMMDHENLGERIFLDRVVLITASGLLGEQPLAK